MACCAPCGNDPEKNTAPESGAVSTETTDKAAETRPSDAVRKPFPTKKVLLAAAAVLVLAALVCAFLPALSGQGRRAPGASAAAPADAASLAELQQYWNRPWYGLMYIEDATGIHAGTRNMDVHMTVKVDDAGLATVCVYIDPYAAPFAACRGSITMDAFVARSGMVLDSSVEEDQWMLVTTNYEDMYALMDTYTAADGSELTYILYVKPWGEDWSEPLKNNHVVPPSYYLSYRQAIAEGEASPVAHR